MEQTYIADLPYLNSIAFESVSSTFKIKSGNLFGRCFGDREFIPSESFKILFEGKELVMLKTNQENIGGSIIFTYTDLNSKVTILAYL